MRARCVLTGFGFADVAMRPTRPGGGASSSTAGLPAQMAASRACELSIFRAFCSESHLRAPGAQLSYSGVGQADVEPSGTHPRASACSVLVGGASREVACGGREVAIFRALPRGVGWCYEHDLEVSAALQRTLESP